MKRKNYYFLIVLLFCALVSCGGKKEKTVNVDLLICESLQGNRLTEQQMKILVPFEKDSIRYLPQGNVLNSKDTICYSKKKTWRDKLNFLQKPLFSEQELIRTHLKGINLSFLSLDNPLSENDVNSYINNYEFVLGFSPEQPQNPSPYLFKIFTTTEEVLSYIKGVVIVNNPEAKVLLVYNPPKVSDVTSDSIISDIVNKTKDGGIKQGTGIIKPPDKKSDNKTVTQLNNLLNKITNSDIDAIDEIRRTVGNNIRVDGASNINNVQQLIIDVSNGNYYKVTKVNRDANGKIISISVSK